MDTKRRQVSHRKLCLRSNSVELAYMQEMMIVFNNVWILHRTGQHRVRLQEDNPHNEKNCDYVSRLLMEAQTGILTRQAEGRMSIKLPDRQRGVSILTWH
jgi:hypothetical protein